MSSSSPARSPPIWPSPRASTTLRKLATMQATSHGRVVTPAQELVKELAAPASHLAPLSGRGRDPRACARIPGEGQGHSLPGGRLYNRKQGPSP